ncbi:hypothetical protein B296_00018212 [Ensete ventricosum]|uniref:Uncharacterized protein n=1 Tax=Ensete ventricosum TaxID=4639 RepID=A0A427A201_ENSVE|nr:hypothetical protein B296_00018212 [Ensete ventricosum]
MQIRRHSSALEDHRRSLFRPENPSSRPSGMTMRPPRILRWQRGGGEGEVAGGRDEGPKTLFSRSSPLLFPLLFLLGARSCAHTPWIPYGEGLYDEETFGGRSPPTNYGITLPEEAMARARARRGGGEQDDSFVGRMDVTASRVGGRSLERQNGLCRPSLG